MAGSDDDTRRMLEQMRARLKEQGMSDETLKTVEAEGQRLHDHGLPDRRAERRRFRSAGAAVPTPRRLLAEPGPADHR